MNRFAELFCATTILFMMLFCFSLGQALQMRDKVAQLQRECEK